MKVSQIVVAFGLLAICFGVVSAGFLERSVYYPTTKVPGCFTNKFNGVNILELVHSEAVPTNGEPVFGVRDEIGRVGRIGQIKSNVCPIAPIATFQSGILHIGTTPCNCPNDNVTPCTPRLKLTTSTERQFVIAEALWSVPIFSFPNALSGNFALINSTVSSSAPVASQGCAAVATSLTGLYALVYAGGCSFQTKVNNAVAGGAIAVVIIQNINTPISIPQIQSSTVPVMMISYNDAQAILATTGTLAVGKPIGVPGVAGAPEVPSGLAFVPFSGLDDDADINTYNNVIRWAKGDVALDDRGYLWVVGVNGENSAKVFDLNTGINNPTLLATLVFDNYRDFLGNSRFVRFTENPSKLFLVGTDNVQGRVLVYDVSDPTNVRLVDFLNENGASKLASTADGKWLYVGSVISASNTAQFTVFSVATDGVLNRVGTVSRTDRSVVNATVSAMTANGLSLYVGWGVYGLSAYDLTRPDRPTFIASFDTYEATTFLNANSTSGVQTLCTVPDLQDVVYVGNSDTFARTSLQAFHLTRANEQFLQTSAADHLITIRTLISGGETQVDVGDQSFVLGSEIAGRHSSSSANTVGVNSDSSNAVTVQISNISELEIVSSSSEVAAPPHRHFVYQNQTLPSNVVIIQIPVPILVNSASSFVPGTTAIIAMFVTMAVVVGLL